MTEITVEQTLAKLLIAIKTIRPFYASVYESMKKEPQIGSGTVGVTEDTLVYDPIFIQTRPFEELLFIMLHEIVHIACQHVSRREDREPSLWNVAADLYTNALLQKEFKIVEPGMTVNVCGYAITAPVDILYSNSISVNEDYVEAIYDSLRDQADENGYTNSEGNYSYEFSYTGKNNWNSRDVFRTTIHKGQYSSELIEVKDGLSSKGKADKLLAEVLVRSSMSGSGASSGTSELLTQVNKILKSELDWKKLLKKYLRKTTQKELSFKTPDRRLFYQKAIYPGDSKLDSNKLNKVKVCIDVSGSISTTDLGYIFGQVESLLKQYKVSAELIYWDTEVKSVGKFQSYKGFESIDCIGGGGTDPMCIFEYLNKQKEKPLVTLIFTDGYFYSDLDFNGYKKKYKDTIWVMTRGYNRNFKPELGKVAVAKFK